MRVADPQCGNVDVTSTASQVRNADAKGDETVTEGLSPLTNTEQTLASHSMSRVEKHKQAGRSGGAHEWDYIRPRVRGWGLHDCTVAAARARPRPGTCESLASHFLAHSSSHEPTGGSAKYREAASGEAASGEEALRAVVHAERCSQSSPCRVPKFAIHSPHKSRALVVLSFG